MLTFPNIEISQRDYSDRIDALLRDDQCIIFLDTNILAKMFALYKGARDEFFAWVIDAKTKNRIKVPAWCLQEYSNKVIRGELKQYTSNFSSSLKTTQKILPQLISQLAMSVDDATAQRKGATDRNDYLTKVYAIREELLRILPEGNLSRGNVDDPASIHKELTLIFGDVVLPSDIFTIMQGCYDDYQTRFDNKVPPGFQDEIKKRNQIGDYIIWRELLEAVKASNGQIKKVLYISNDSKNDWVYRPQYILNSRNKRIGNSQQDGIYLIDPRLEYELSLAAGTSVDVMLIDFEHLVSSLANQQTGNFTLLASAIQLISATDAATTSVATPATSSEETIETLVEEAQLAENEPPTPDESAPVLPTIETVDGSDDSTFHYSMQALADSTYVIPDNTVGTIIADLKYLTWDVQNAAVSKINSYLLNTSNIEDLFVLGRNITQSAAGSSYAAIDFIERFPNNLPKAGTEPLKSLFNGMLYEMYFNSKNEFRGAMGKATFIDRLYSAYQNYPSKLDECGFFMKAVLTPYYGRVLYIPTQEEKIHTITLSFRTIENERYRCVLDSCLIDDKTISQNIDEYSTIDTKHLKRLLFYDDSIMKLINAIRLSRYIPDFYFQGKYLLDGNPVPESTVASFITPEWLYV